MQEQSELDPDLSICLPTYNRARYLDCLLQDLAEKISALGYTYELLIGDNASTDNTTEIVQKHKDRLNIKYIKRPKNVGMYHNLSELYAVARGRYSVYLADDDLLILDALRRQLDYLEANHDVGAVFAPWLIHDRVAGVDVDQFYSVDVTTRIEVGDHASLFKLLVNGHIFPEIYVARTSLARRIVGAPNAFAFIFFVQISAMVERIAVAFSPEPFYRQVIPYFEDETAIHNGHEEVKMGWDRYRGGLEYVLAKFAPRLSAADLEWCHRAIDRFTRIRMSVALRLRTAEATNWIDNYYIANRLRSTGDDSLLPVPYLTYRINAAFEYLIGLNPFYPETACIGYYEGDPPLIISQANGYNSAGLLVLERSKQVPRGTILLVDRERWSAPAGSSEVFVTSEAELLARFL